MSKIGLKKTNIRYADALDLGAPIYENVYFSMLGTAAAHNYGPRGGRYYVVEALGPVEIDPEILTFRRQLSCGSLRCKRAVVVEIASFEDVIGEYPSGHNLDAWVRERA